jgi:hypothetical protein
MPLYDVFNKLMNNFRSSTYHLNLTAFVKKLFAVLNPLSAAHYQRLSPFISLYLLSVRYLFPVAYNLLHNG